MGFWESGVEGGQDIHISAGELYVFNCPWATRFHHLRCAYYILRAILRDRSRLIDKYHRNQQCRLYIKAQKSRKEVTTGR